MKTSLQHRLSAFISGAVLVIAGSAAVFTFFASLNDAHIAQDKQLRQTAYLVSRFENGPVTLAARKRVDGIRLEERIVVRFLRDPGAEPPAGQEQAPAFSNSLADGAQTVSIGDESWRVFVHTDDDGVRIAVAQQTAVREAVAIRSALRSLIPFAFLALVLLVLVRLLIRTLFSPVLDLAVDLGKRADGDLSQLDPDGLPDEVRPFVTEINRLLNRVDNALQAQRRFVADAAHELRSPLTALTLQTERLSAAEMPEEARRRMLALVDGLKRTRAMLDQLLALARSQQGGASPAAPVSLQHTLRLVIEELYPLAEEKEVDLGVIGTDDACVAAAALDLHIMLKNLVDNAIRYSPAGGRVDLSVRPGAAAVDFIVDDTGPGIPEAERARVFDAFYRILGNRPEPGSGLGLAIVSAIANKTGATVTFAAPPHGAGLRVLVRLPLHGRRGTRST